MKLKSFLILLITTLALMFFSPLPVAVAASSAPNQSNQAMHRPAMLIAPKPNAPVKLYAQPDLRKGKVGLGLGGDRVTVLRQVGSNEGKLWSYVSLDKDAKTEGWVREDFLSFDNQPLSKPRQEKGKRQQTQKQQAQTQQTQNYRQ